MALAVPNRAGHVNVSPVIPFNKFLEAKVRGGKNEVSLGRREQQ